MIRVVHHLALCLALGGLVLLWLRASDGSLLIAHRLKKFIGFALLTALLIAIVLLSSHGQVLLPEANFTERINAALSTWIGQIIALQAALNLAALLCVSFTRWVALSLALAFTSAALTALRSHVIAAGDTGAPSLAALVHIVIALLWLSSLASLLLAQWIRQQQGGFDWRAMLQAISRPALPAMLLLLMTGVVLADRTVGTGAALVATPYGTALILKLLMVSCALFCAWHLRRWLAQSSADKTESAMRWLRIESGFAVTVLALAGLMAITIPAAHDTIHWPWAFRIAPLAAYLQRGAEVLWWQLGALALLIASGLLVLYIQRYSRVRAWLVGAGGVVVAVGLGVPAISVDAYPSTYSHSPLPYDAQAIHVGERLYQQWCVDCHGVHGRGDGPLASTLRKPPANLTEPHVQWHTHGDLYWWITNGITASGMPGFRQQMTDDERWQLLNFLAAMSLGYEARPLSTRVSPRDPWLPAIDFRYTAPDGEPVSLFTWREQGRMVLLHFVDDRPVSAVTSVPQDAGFAKQVAMLRSVLDAHAAKCIVVRAEPTAKQPLTAEDGKAAVTKIDPGIPCDVVSDHEQTIDTAWSQYRRSLSDPDFKNERVTARGMWFLIDRFGFVRARWAADEPAPSSEQLASSLKQLISEPEIRSVDIHARR